MLDAIRKRSASLVVKLLLGLLVISFAAWGVGDYVGGGVTGAAVVSVGDRDIGQQALRDAVNSEIRRFSQLLGGQLDPEQARALGVVDKVVGDLVNQALFAQGAAELGVTISDALIRQTIESNPAFNGPLGRFDAQRFQLVLSNAGLGETRYVAMMRDDLARQQYLASLAGGAVAPAVLQRRLFAYRQERRIAETFTVTDAAMPGPGQPTAQQMQDYYKGNQPRFTAPERRSLTVVRLEAEALMGEVKVTEQQIREAYEARAEEFNEPERRVLDQMVLESQAVAEKAVALLEAGRGFAETAAEVAGLKAADLRVGPVSRAELLPELADVAFGLSAGGRSGPVESPLGWHLLKLVEVKAARQKTLEDMRPGLQKAVAREKAVDGLYKLSNRLEDALGSGATLEEAASRLGLMLVKADGLDATGKLASGAPAKELPGGSFLDVAFSTGEGQESVLTETGADGYFVVRVDAVTPPAAKPIDAVRADVIAGWQAAARQQAAREKAEALVIRAGAVSTLEGLAAEVGAKTARTAPFTRRGAGTEPPLPADLIQALFKATPGAAVQARGAGGFVVARLIDVRPASADKAASDAIAQEVRAGMESDLLGQLAATLRLDHPVRINRAVLDQLF